MTPEEKLKSLLRELFQVDHSDLDFGIYRIMRLRRGEVEEFLDKRLAARLEEVRGHLAARGAEAVRAELEELRPQLRAAYGADFESQLEKFRGVDLAERWLELNERLADARVADETVNEIYNHLCAFFDRYYDDGDFLPKPRSSGYRIPYDGSDVVLHWATKDMYYIKTGESFKSYAFDNGLTGNERTRCEFRIRDAETPLNNNKAESGRAYVPSGPEYLEWDADTRTLILRFEYRKPTDDEAATWGKSNRATKKGDATINDRVMADLEKRVPKFKDPYLDKFLVSERGRSEEKTRTFLYHLNRYTTLNQFDYFIHKNLRNFLETELDQYLKDHVLGLAFLNPDWNERDVEKAVRRNVVRAGCIRDLALAIIRMLSDLEEFQKRLFLKKKYVVRSDYCMTLDLVPADVRGDLIQEILSDADARQLRNWHELGFLFESPLLDGETLKQGKALRSADVRAWIEAHDKLVVDTALVSEDVKWRILCGIDELDEKCGGLLIKSENLQGLRMVGPRWGGGVQCVYADPPYNTDAGPITYKNGYRHSSWVSLMLDRLTSAVELLQPAGILCVTIDDTELPVLRSLLETLLDPANILGTVPIKNNPAGRTGTVGFAVCHEYALFVARSAESRVGRLPHSEKQRARYKEQDELGFFEWTNFRKHGGANTYRRTRPRQFYPLYVHGSRIRIPQMAWDNEVRAWSVEEEPRRGEEVILPIDDQGRERIWDFNADTARSNLKHMIVRKDSNGNTAVYRKWRLNSSGMLPQTWWDKSAFSAVEYGTNLLARMFGEAHRFMFPKSLHAVVDCLRVAGLEPNTVVIDPFAGSGTTGHAVLQLNRADGGGRGYSLIEGEDYFHTVLKPRIQKVMFSAKWKNGRPVLDPDAAARIPEPSADDENDDDDAVNDDDDDANGPEADANGDVYGGVTHMFQYLSLEQYEDTLNNIVFTDSPQNILGNDPADVRAAIGELFPEEERLSYYFTEGSWMSPALGLSDLIRDPFSARLKITEQNEPKDTPIDPITTFNFLLGLRVRRYVVTEQQGRRVVIVFGRKDSEEHVLIWRKCEDTWDPDIERAWIQEQDWFKTSTVWTNGHNSFGGNRIEPELKRLMFEDVD